MYHEIYHIYLPDIVRKISVNQLTVLHCSIFTIKITIMFCTFTQQKWFPACSVALIYAVVLCLLTL